MDIWTIFMQNSQYVVTGESLFFHKACSIAQTPLLKRKRSVILTGPLGQKLKTYLSFLVILSFDRYLCVVYPIETMIYRTLKNAVIGCIISWIRFNNLSGQSLSLIITPFSFKATLHSLRNSFGKIDSKPMIPATVEWTRTRPSPFSKCPCLLVGLSL